MSTSSCLACRKPRLSWKEPSSPGSYIAPDHRPAPSGGAGIRDSPFDAPTNPHRRCMGANPSDTGPPRTSGGGARTNDRGSGHSFPAPPPGSSRKTRTTRRSSPPSRCCTGTSRRANSSTAAGSCAAAGPMTTASRWSVPRVIAERAPRAPRMVSTTEASASSSMRQAAGISGRIDAIRRSSIRERSALSSSSGAVSGGIAVRV
mmetsp:Transcript_19401/g.63395  ORF Transcript_19401/g.63395 Transcript_19401/m.63395 type:complete len:204 (+) Transcript_19401:266-877(+)